MTPHLLLALSLLTGAPSAAPNDATPEAIVEALYKVGGISLESKNTRELSTYFSPTMVKAVVDADAECKHPTHPGVCMPDFDVMYAAQDTNITELKVGTFDAASSTVPVSFKNFGKLTRVTMLMVQTPSGWRIDDILYPDNKVERSLAHDVLGVPKVAGKNQPKAR
jgi:hypothetical protein